MRDGEGILQQAPLEYCVLQLAHPKNKKMLIYVTRNARLGVVRNTIPPAFSQLSLERIQKEGATPLALPLT